MKAYDIRKIIAAEMWYYRRSLNITFKDSRTNVSILEQLNTKGELNGKLTYFGHMSGNKSTITKDILRGKIEGKKRNNPLVLYGECKTVDQHDHRVAWREKCWRAMQAANLSTDDAA